MRRIFVSVSLLWLVVSISCNAFAQTGNASLGGGVSDKTKALIPGVTIKATDLNTGVVTSTITNDTGSYNFPTLLPGTYKVSAELTGFKSVVNNNVPLGVSSQVRLNFTLELGTSSTAIDVTVNGQA